MNVKCPKCGAVAVVEIKAGGRYGIGGDTRTDALCLELKERPAQQTARHCPALVGEVERIVRRRR
jgi:hypothetical protein